MTVEEAIKRIDDILDSDVHWDESIDYKLMSIDVDWLGKSKEALKKQIPKKVIPFAKSGIAMACPECGTFQDFIDENATLDNKSEYCYKCGQALDWSDSK